MTRDEERVLEHIHYGYEEFAYNFRGIMDATGLPRERVRAACRSLAQRGYAMFMRGLMTESGELAGAGYACTRRGNEAWHAVMAIKDPGPIICACGKEFSGIAA